jgi:glycerophosphoryl diester phosphodiesterase
MVMVSSCTMTGSLTSLSDEKTNIELKTLDDLYKFLTHTDSRIPLISAHRGGPEPGFPENAIETFERSARRQPLIIECDVTLTKDSILVLMHDEKLDRTSNGTGYIKDYTFKELQDLRLKDNDGKLTSYLIPSLERALEWGAGKVIYTLDIKRNVPYDLVIDLIRRKKAAAFTVLITYSATQAAKVHKLAPEMMISASITKPEDLIRLNDYGVPDNRLIAFVGTSEAQPETYQFLHEHGILCILGTMGNLDDQAETKGDVLYFDMIDRGADILSTDRPVESGIQLQKYRADYRLNSDFIK